MSRKDFARENGFSVNTFDHYRYKLALDKEIKPRGPFVGEKENVIVLEKCAVSEGRNSVKMNSLNGLIITRLNRRTNMIELNIVLSSLL